MDLKPTESSASPAAAPTLVSANEFKRVDLRTAKILDANEHPNADRLWVLKLDIGEGKTKEIVAGVRSHYTSKESLINKTIILVNNLEPATIRGVTSNGMMLAARHADVLALLTTDPTVPPGTKIS